MNRNYCQISPLYFFLIPQKLPSPVAAATMGRVDVDHAIEELTLGEKVALTAGQLHAQTILIKADIP